MATYWSIPRPGGALYGKAQGVIMTNDGTEMATYNAQAVRRFTGPDRRVSFRGSLFYRTYSTEGKLASINDLVGIFEYEMDESGSSTAKVWELR
jgi:hypothetical protein